MVTGINTTDNQKSNFTNFTKPHLVNTSPAQTNSEPQAVIVKNDKPKKSTDKLQMASLIVGGLASSAFLILILKSLVPYKKNKELLNIIQNADIPGHVKNKVLFE